MIITRDDDYGAVCFWRHGTPVRLAEGFWDHEGWQEDAGLTLMAELSPEEFKLEYPTKKLPRKGSKLSVPKRDYFATGSTIHALVGVRK